MSRHLPYRLSVIHSAILATTLGISSMAHAISLGQPTVQSEQHEPLSATINVSGIDAKSFNVSLANGAIYQQMGLNQTNGMQVRFMPVSDTAGVILLSSSQPVSTPFADVVLNLENGNEHFVEAQTLLMPLPKNSKVEPSTTAQQMITAPAQVDLPVVAQNTEPTGTPLAVQMTAPPPLFAETHETIVQSNVANAQHTNTQGQTTETSLWADDAAPIPTNIQAANQATSQATTNARIMSEEERVIASITPEGTNTQINILTEQIIRRVLPRGATPSPTPTSLGQPLDEPALAQIPTQPNQSANAAADSNEQQISDAPVYVVQSGDNLWSIANQIAKANDMSVNDVMKELHTQNPNAFNNNNINQLKANVSLSIPNYAVIPSQKAIADAISAQRKSNSQATSNRSSTARTQTRAQRPASSSQAHSSRTVSRPLPRPQVTLVTPSQSGQATGSQNRSNAVSGGAGNDEQLVNTLRNTRNQTAQNARRVNSLNQELNSATQRLQLQNERLAELEARLKALRENK